MGEFPLKIQQALEDAVAESGMVTADEILGRRRFQHVVAARRNFARKLRTLGLSYPAISDVLGMDHTSVMYLCGARRIKR